MEEEVKNLTRDEVLDVIREFPVQPTRGNLIITVNVETPDNDGVDLRGVTFSEIQYVIASTEFSSYIKPGQKVILDIERMMEYIDTDSNSYEKVGRIKLKPLEVNGITYAMIKDNYVDALDNRED